MPNGLLIVQEILSSDKNKLALECLDCWGDSHR